MTSKDEIQKKALAAVKGKIRCGLGITMGGGKTLVGLQHMADLYRSGARFLVVAPRRSIFNVWDTTARKFGLSYLLSSISYSTYLSLNKQPLDFTAVYLDECHSLLFSHNDWLEQFNGFILGLTGTPPRFASSEKGQMVERFCPIVYTYLTDEAVKDRVMNDYRIVIHHLKLDERKTVCLRNKKTGQEWHTSEVESYRYWNNKLARMYPVGPSKEGEWFRLQRMRVLMGFRSKVVYARQLLGTLTNKTIVFANTQEQAEAICTHSYHASNPESQKNLELFLCGDIHCLSSVSQLNEGVNIPDLKEGILLHAYSNERKTAQRIGRLLRLNPTDRATAHIFCYDDTVDENWVQAALQDFDGEKIFHYYPDKQMLFTIYGQRVDGPPHLFRELDYGKSLA